MPKSLKKTAKHISKKRGGEVTALHEGSRDSLSLRRAGGRDDKLERMAAERKRHNRPICMYLTRCVQASIQLTQYHSGASSLFPKCHKGKRSAATRTRCDP